MHEMNDRIERTTTESVNSVTNAVTVACQLAGRDEIRSVRVVSRQRPTYDALLRCRRLAVARGLDLTVDTGCVSVRPRSTLSEPAGAAAPRPSSTVPSGWPLAAQGWLRFSIRGQSQRHETLEHVLAGGETAPHATPITRRTTMRTEMHITPRAGSESISDMLGIASQLAGREEIGSIEVVSGRRPTSDELVRFQHWADVSGLELSETSLGVSFRPRHSRAPAPPATEKDHDWSAAFARRFTPVLNWWRIHGEHWRTELATMSEGTR
jgi:hypothetical protein